MDSTWCLSKTSSEEFNDLSGKNILGDQATPKADGQCVGDPLSTNKHEPLDASHGARIMARQVGVSFLLPLFFSESVVRFSVACFNKEKLLLGSKKKIWKQIFQTRAMVKFCEI